jgi:hypothetical protein
MKRSRVPEPAERSPEWYRRKKQGVVWFALGTVAVGAGFVWLVSTDAQSSLCDLSCLYLNSVAAAPFGLLAFGLYMFWLHKRGKLYLKPGTKRATVLPLATVLGLSAGFNLVMRGRSSVMQVRAVGLLAGAILMGMAHFYIAWTREEQMDQSLFDPSTTNS